MDAGTIYTFGDFNTIMYGLHAVAALFNPDNTDLIVGKGTLGLGAAVAVGSLITLFIVLFQGITSQRLEIHSILLGILLFVMLFVPKTTVRVEDYFSGQVTTVDNVPIGVAYTASAMSSAFISMAEKMDTMFQMADSRYPTLSQDHFMSSLIILGHIDSTIEGIKRALPSLVHNIDMVIRFCVDRDTINIAALAQQQGAFHKILENVRQGGQVIYKPMSGEKDTVVSCPMMASRILDDMSNMLADPKSEADFVKNLVSGTYASVLLETAEDRSHTERFLKL